MTHPDKQAALDAAQRLIQKQAEYNAKGTSIVDTWALPMARLCIAQAAELERVRMENAELWLCIHQVSPHIPKADSTCEKPGITFEQAVKESVAATLKKAS